MAVRKSAKEIHYVRNLTFDPVRILDITVGPRGEVDVAQVPATVFNDTKFRPSLNKLVEEIDEETYLFRLEEGQNNPERRPRRPDLTELNKKKVYTVDLKTGEETEMPVYVEKKDYRDEDHEQGGQHDLDASRYPGASHAMGTLPDPGRGKTLSEMRQGQ